jgi:hypothetical protein
MKLSKLAASLQVRHDEGSNVIEFAITLIFYLLMLFGIIDFSRLLYTYHFVAHAAREGARWAIVNGSNCHNDPDAPSCPYANGAQESDVASYVANFIPPGIVKTGPNGVQVTAPCGVDGAPRCSSSPSTCIKTTDGSYNAPGCVVEVTVTYPFTFLFPLVKTATLNLTSTSAMVISH